MERSPPAWRHPGFSAHVGEAIPFEDKKAIEDVACYVVRNPLSLKKLVYLDGQRAVLYRSKMNPSLGRDRERQRAEAGELRLGEGRRQLRGDGPSGMAGAHGRPHPRRRETSHPLLWLLRKPRQGLSAGDGNAGRPAEPAPAKRRCSPSWARLISKVYQADPLVCKGCGGPLKIVAYINDQISIKRILDHLELSPPGQEEPAPTPELVRVPVDDEGREILAG